MNRRSGATLVEVLVAIFVMGLGLIALLTLFPVGAIRMAQAIHDDRCALCVQNALATAVIQGLTSDPTVVSAPGDALGPIADMFANPHPFAAGGKALVNADPYHASYAIWVDPIGYYSVPAGNARDWVAGITGVLRRRPVSFVAPAGATAAQRNENIYQSFSLLDDMNFNYTDTPASPQVPAGTTRIFRESRFSWAYLLRRRQTSQVSAVDITAVIFNNRPLALTTAGATAQVGNLMTLRENVYTTSYFDPTKNVITIDYTATGVPPPIQVGSWILDASIVHPTATTAMQHAYFYRVVAINDPIVINGPPVRNLMQFEVQLPLRGWGGATQPPEGLPPYPPGPPAPTPLPPNGYPPGYPAPPYQPYPLDITNPAPPVPATGLTLGFIGTAIVIDGIAEVIEKGPASPAP